MKAFICINMEKDGNKEMLMLILPKLTFFGIIPLILAEMQGTVQCETAIYGSVQQLSTQCDVFLTIGGDGTILYWGKLAATLGKPLLGINTGRVGFMATLETESLDDIRNLVNGDYFISERSLLSVNITKDNYTKNYTALNDVVLTKGISSKLPEFTVFSGENVVTKFHADGLIISTATGSTAYSLSAGGPIIEPELDLIELTPLSAHTLFSRTMLFSFKNAISVKFSKYVNTSVNVSIDGNDGIPYQEEDRITIEKSPFVLQLIDINGNNFYNAIHNKLMKSFK